MADKPGLQDMEGFTLGSPSLVCRWRIAGGTLPLMNRHMRALGARRVNGHRVSTELVAWAKQNVEWSLAGSAEEHPDGVLMLIVDERGQAAMTVGPYEPLPSLALGAIARRALDSAREAQTSGVAPETLVCVRDGALLYDLESGQPESGVLTLVSDLAKTFGIPVTRAEGLAAAVVSGEPCEGEFLLASDEHGIVEAADRAGGLAARLAGSYQTLLAKARRTHAAR